jgi:TolB protein
MLPACANVNAAAPTPTIVPLDRTALAQAEATSTPTLTPIPLPSPTPSPTPLPTAGGAAAAPVTVTTSAVLSATGQTAARAEITAAALNIRQGPGLDYSVIATALQGDTFEVTGTDRFRYWLQIRLPDGRIGWISGHPSYARLLSGNLADLPVVDGAPSFPAAGSTGAATGINPVSQPAATNSGVERLIFNTASGGDLYSLNIDGTNLRHLASGVIDPVVSPDGQWVAFTRWDGAEFGALFILNLSHGEERAVVGDIRQPKSPAWSPDGQKIVISFQHGGIRDPQTECREYDSGERVRIPENVIIKKFDVKGDGSVELCFQRIEDLLWMLRQVDIATGQFEDLPTDEYSYNPTWDPQNPWRVIYDGKAGLMQFDVNTREQWPLTEDIRDTGPVFSPDGKMLALTYKQHDHWEVYTLDPASGSRNRLTKPPILVTPQYNSAAPTWSPDGSQIAFITDRTGRWELWVMNADGSNPHPLFPPDLQTQLGLRYDGVNERMLSWVK